MIIKIVWNQFYRSLHFRAILLYITNFYKFSTPISWVSFVCYAFISTFLQIWTAIWRFLRISIFMNYVIRISPIFFFFNFKVTLSFLPIPDFSFQDLYLKFATKKPRAGLFIINASIWLYPLHPYTLQRRHNEPDGVSNHQPYDCLLNRLFRRWPVNSPHKGSVTRKMFPFDDVIMKSWNSYSVNSRKIHHT